jgi:rubrerythrin
MDSPSCNGDPYHCVRWASSTKMTIDILSYEFIARSATIREGGNMKVSVALTTSILAIMFFTIGHSGAQSETRPNDQTLSSLSAAMHGEAFAYAKYMLYADHARWAGDTELADLLEKTANNELEHFAEEAKLGALVGSNLDNLKDAIRCEFYESETMYREFAQQAEEVGDHEIALRLEEIRQDEAKHRDDFDAALVPRLEENGYPGDRVRHGW